MRASETSLGLSEGSTRASTTSPSHDLVRAVLGTLVGASVFAAGLVLDPALLVLLSAQRVMGQIDASFAYAALGLVIGGLCILFTSATFTLSSRSSNDIDGNPASTLSTLTRIFSKGPYSRVLLVSAVLYGVFYGLASGIIVVQLPTNFSAIYHISTPSILVATCCGAIGENPVATVLVTEHFGLVLIPLNLLFLFSISWLVGLNIALAAFALQLRTEKIAIGRVGFGAFGGLFTACPTCAGLAMLSLIPGIGGVGGLATILLMDPVRVFFIATSYLTLIIGSFATAKALSRIINYGCAARLV